MTGIALLSKSFRPRESAPNGFYVPVYYVLGVIFALSYQIGKLFSRKCPSTSKTDSKFRIVSKSRASDGTLAVVIPAFITSNDEKRLLESAVDIITSSCGFQVFVIDDCSPLALSPKNCTVIRHVRNQGPASARNTGIQAALESGVKSIAFMDSDCIPTSDWAVEHAKLQEKNPGIWAGRTLSKGDSIIPQFHERTGTLMPFVRNDAIDSVFFAPTCNLSVSANVAEELRFDPEFRSSHEDCDFCFRAIELGYHIRISRKPVLKHEFRAGLFNFCRLGWKYGRSEKLMNAKHPSFQEAMSTCDSVSLLWSKIQD